MNIEKMMPIAYIPTELNLILIPLLTVFKLWNIIESGSGEFLINCFMGNWQEVGCSGGWMGRSIRLPTPITGPRSRGHFLSGFTITSNQGPSQDQNWLHSGAAIIRNIHYVWYFEGDIFQGEDLFCPTFYIFAPLVVAGRLPLLHGFVSLTDADSTHPQTHPQTNNNKKRNQKGIICRIIFKTI